MIGYDKYPLYKDLLVDLRFEEYSGVITRDLARPHHSNPTLVNGVAWSKVGKLSILDFDDTAFHYVRINNADSADCNFTTESFSGALWWYSDDVSPFAWFICRGAYDTSGWMFQVNGDNPGVILETVQAGPSTIVSGASLASTGALTNTWRFLGFTRNGTSVRIYCNGIDRTDFIGAHNAILPTAVEHLHFGSYDNAGSGYSDGKMWRPRVWSRCLSPAEMRYIFQTERHLFGV